MELEGFGWPRYIRTPPTGSPPPGSPSVSLGHCYDQGLCFRVKWLEGRPTRTGKGGSGGVAEPIAALEKLLILSLVCGYVIFIEVATELGGIGRLISDRITAEVDTFEDEIALLTKLLALRFADLQSVLHISPAIPPCLGLCCRTGCSVSHRH